jgi:PqqD family protein of HPr-rel-A system
LTRPRTSDNSKWRSRSPDEIVWAQFDDEFVAYHRSSGQTHFLNKASHLLICDILHEARDFKEIADEFAEDDIDGHPKGYYEEMKAMLDRLEMLGLVERV